MVSPEQSNPSCGLSPPHLYGTPITERAAATAVSAPGLGGGGGGGVGVGVGGRPPGAGGGPGWERRPWRARLERSLSLCSARAFCAVVAPSVATCRVDG